MEVDPGVVRALQRIRAAVAEGSAFVEEHLPGLDHDLVQFAPGILDAERPRALGRLADADRRADDVRLRRIGMFVEVGAPLVDADPVAGRGEQRESASRLVHGLERQEESTIELRIVVEARRRTPGLDGADILRDVTRLLVETVEIRLQSPPQ